MPEELSAQTIVARRYRLVRVLGEGGMGSVWAAKHVETGADVALKFVRGPADDVHRRRLAREARAAMAVRHPNVVRVHEILESDDGTPVLVMDLLEGESLDQRLARDGELPIGEAASVLRQVAAGVAAAHAARVTHRDLKPANVFLVKGADPRERVRILDFGIAKIAPREEDGASESTGLTTSGALLGSPAFMSPEQVMGQKDVDARTDIWSMGLMLYQAITGALPTDGKNVGLVLNHILTRPIPPIAAVLPSTPAPIADLVDRMLSRDREARPSVAEVERVLGPFAGDGAIEPAREDREAIPRAFDPTVATLVQVPARPARWPLIAIALAMLVLVSAILALSSAR